MKQTYLKPSGAMAALLFALAFAVLAGCSDNNAGLQAQLKQFSDERAMQEKNKELVKNLLKPLLT